MLRYVDMILLIQIRFQWGGLCAMDCFSNQNTSKIRSTILKEWITTDSQNTPSTTNPEDEEIVDAPGKYGNTLMPEQVNRPNTWRKMIIIIIIIIIMNLLYAKYLVNWQGFQLYSMSELQLLAAGNH